MKSGDLERESEGETSGVPPLRKVQASQKDKFLESMTRSKMS